MSPGRHPCSSPSWCCSPANARLWRAKVGGGVVVGEKSQIPSDVPRQKNPVHRVDDCDPISYKAGAKVEGKVKRTQTVERLAVSSDDLLSERSLEPVERESQRVELLTSNDRGVCAGVWCSEKLTKGPRPVNGCAAK